MSQEFSYSEAVKECGFSTNFISCQKDLFYAVDENRLIAVKKPSKSGFTTAAAHLMAAGLLKKPGFKGLFIAPTHGDYEKTLNLIGSILPNSVAELDNNNIKLISDDSEVTVIAGYRFAKTDLKYDMVVVDEYAWQRDDPLTGYTHYGSVSNAILEIIQLNSEKVIVGSTPGPTKEKGGVLNKFYSLWIHDNEYVKLSWDRNDLIKDEIDWNNPNLDYARTFGIFTEQPKDKWPQKSNDTISLERRGKEFKLSFRSEDGTTLSKCLSLDQMHQITIKFSNLILSEKRQLEELDALMNSSSPEDKSTDRSLEKTYEEWKWKDNLGCDEAKQFRAKIVSPLEVEENWGK